MSFAELTGAKKEEMLASLAVLVISDSAGEMSADAINAVVEASGNKISSAFATVFASAIAKAGNDFNNFTPAPGSGGGGGGGGGGAAPAAAAAKEEVVEEEEVDMGGSMDMFGGEATGGGDY